MHLRSLHCALCSSRGEEGRLSAKSLWLCPRLQKVRPQRSTIKMTKPSCLLLNSHSSSNRRSLPIDLRRPAARCFLVIVIERLQKVIESKVESFRKRLWRDRQRVRPWVQFWRHREMERGLESRANLCVKILPDLQSRW